MSPGMGIITPGPAAGRFLAAITLAGPRHASPRRLLLYEDGRFRWARFLYQYPFFSYLLFVLRERARK